MSEKDNLYPSLKELLHQLKSENADSESTSKSEISEPPPGYEEIFGRYISEGLNIYFSLQNFRCSDQEIESGSAVAGASTLAQF